MPRIHANRAFMIAIRARIRQIVLLAIKPPTSELFRTEDAFRSADIMNRELLSPTNVRIPALTALTKVQGALPASPTSVWWGFRASIVRFLRVLSAHRRMCVRNVTLPRLFSSKMAVNKHLINLFQLT